MEDIVAVVDGRSEIVNDVMGADIALREFLSIRFTELLSDDGRFREAVSGHLPPDGVSQVRAPLVIDRLYALATKI